MKPLYDTDSLDDEEWAKGMLRMDGYDDCLIGVCLRFGQPPIIAYDMGKVIRRLMADGMSEEEAVEFMQFNQLGAWLGDTTPCFIDTDP